MKLVIDIPEDLYKWIKDMYENPNGEVAYSAIKNSIPYEAEGDLISREALKEKLKPCEADVCEFSCEDCHFRVVTAEDIDNAPTVLHDNYSMGYQDGVRKVLSERPKGKWVKIFDNPFTNGYVCPFCGHKIQVTEQFLPEVTECEVCGAELKEDTPHA